MQTLDIIFLVALGSLTLLLTLLAILFDLKVVCNKITKENEYYLHTLLLSKSLIAAFYIIDVAQEQDGIKPSFCKTSTAIKMVSFDVGMMVSLAYLHLFRMNVKNAKNPVRRNVFSLFMIVAVPTIRAIFTDKCSNSYTVAM